MGFLNRLRVFMAKCAHLGALGFILLAVAVFLNGGIGVDIAGFTPDANVIYKPVLAALLCAGLGKLFYAPLLLKDTISFQLYRAFKKLSPRKRWTLAIILVVVAAIIFSFTVTRKAHIRTAKKYLGEGNAAMAAEHFSKAMGFLYAKNHYLRGQRALMLGRAGLYDKCVEEYLPRFEAEKSFHKNAYLGLWRCLIAKDRLTEAIEVIERGMGAYQSLDKRGAGVLARIRRQLANKDSEKRVKAHFQFCPKSENPPMTPLYLSGNWSIKGRQAENEGWHPKAMVRNEETGCWFTTVDLEPPTRLPYVALVSPGNNFREASAIGLRQFWLLKNEKTDGAYRYDFLPVTAPQNQPKAQSRQAGEDGRKRTLAIWPDAGTWFFVNHFMRRGFLPNLTKLYDKSARGEMVSTHPPFTSTAYLRMVKLGNYLSKGQSNDLLGALIIQLKGIPFLDRFFPDDMASAVNDPHSIFYILGQKNLSAVNLVFNDKFMNSQTDMRMNNGTQLNIEVISGRKKRELTEDETQDVIGDALGINKVIDPHRFQAVSEAPIFILGTQNTELKAKIGMQVWKEQKPDFMLLRFPSVDILSHKFYGNSEENPVYNMMLETYRHFDLVLGRFIQELDQDDTLIVVSDHGIEGTMAHHPMCMLMIDGPQIKPGSVMETIPIAHFPVVVLSRFGIKNGSDRLTPEMRKTLFAH